MMERLGRNDELSRKTEFNEFKPTKYGVVFLIKC